VAIAVLGASVPADSCMLVKIAEALMSSRNF
jgi:hypothetical protein